MQASVYPTPVWRPYAPLQSARPLLPAAASLGYGVVSVAQPFSGETSVNPFSRWKKPGPPPTATQRAWAGVRSAAFLAAALLLLWKQPQQARTQAGKTARQLMQARNWSIPPDWQVWTKMGLGMGALGSLNQALNFQPPPWLGAIMNVGLLTPLISGFQANTFRMMPLLMPAIAGLVQGTAVISHHAEKPLQEQLGLPPVATKLLFSVLSTVVGFFGMPALFSVGRSMKLVIPPPETLLATGPAKPGAPQPAFPPGNKLAPAEQGTRVAIAQSCARGCCSSVICMNEVVDNLSVLGSGVQSHFQAPHRDHPPARPPLPST